MLSKVGLAQGWSVERSVPAGGRPNYMVRVGDEEVDGGWLSRGLPGACEENPFLSISPTLGLAFFFLFRGNEFDSSAPKNSGLTLLMAAATARRRTFWSFHFPFRRDQTRVCATHWTRATSRDSSITPVTPIWITWEGVACPLPLTAFLQCS